MPTVFVNHLALQYDVGQVCRTSKADHLHLTDLLRFRYPGPLLADFQELLCDIECYQVASSWVWAKTGKNQFQRQDTLRESLSRRVYQQGARTPRLLQHGALSESRASWRLVRGCHELCEKPELLPTYDNSREQ